MTNKLFAAVTGSILLAVVGPACVEGPDLVAPAVSDSTVFTCYTQPREYIWTDGSHHMEVDWYESRTPCPEVRID